MTAMLPALPLACVLGLAAALAALMAARMRGPVREPARGYLRFAAGLAMALALAGLLGGFANAVTATAFASGVMALVAALAPAALVLALAARYSGPPRTFAASWALVTACLFGLVATATGNIFFAFAPLVIAALALAVLALGAWRQAAGSALFAGIGALSLVAAASAAMSGGPQAFGLFFSAALLGVALAVTRGSDAPVEARAGRRARKPLFIRSRR